MVGNLILTFRLPAAPLVSQRSAKRRVSKACPELDEGRLASPLRGPLLVAKGTSGRAGLSVLAVSVFLHALREIGQIPEELVEGETERKQALDFVG
jgi:hypothetical protein